MPIPNAREGPDPVPEREFLFATLSDVGTERPNNEDSCGSLRESPTHLLIAVADGVGGYEAGEVASKTAIDTLLRSYEESNQAWGADKRLYRAAQQANIEVYDRAIVVPELRGMATTLTALVVDGSRAHVAHVGDSRLYLIRNQRVLQKTKDHTVAASRQRIGLLNAADAKEHPGRSVLTRSVGKDLIAQVDRITFSIEAGDVLVLCSDGLYNVLPDDELKEAVLDKEPTSACAATIDAANTRGTPDNLTVAVVQVVGGAGASVRSGWRGFFAKVLGH